jgi:hypothetical protein
MNAATSPSSRRVCFSQSLNIVICIALINPYVVLYFSAHLANSFIHRSISGFIVQGGGFTVDSEPQPEP